MPHCMYDESNAQYATVGATKPGGGGPGAGFGVLHHGSAEDPLPSMHEAAVAAQSTEEQEWKRTEKYDDQCSAQGGVAVCMNTPQGLVCKCMSE